MTNWHRKTSYTDRNGGTVHVKTKNLDALTGTQTTWLGAAVGDAVDCVRDTITALQTPWESLSRDTRAKVRDAIATFFATGTRSNLPFGGLTDTQVRQVIAKLELIANGLNQPEMNIKVGDNAENSGRLGRVNVHLTKGFGGTINASKSVFNLKQSTGISMNLTMRMGDISVQKSEVVNKPKGDLIVLLIHEASHKYAGTWDHSYVAPRTRTLENAITTPQCLENADSYGHLCGKMSDYF
jgi:hypothetical protein